MAATLQNQIVWYRRAQWGMTGAMLLGAVLFFTVWYHPATEQLATLNDQIIEKRHQLEAAQAKAGEFAQLGIAVEKKKKNLQQYNKKLPKQSEMAAFITDITNVCRQTAVREFKYTPVGVKKLDPIVELPINMNFEGNFLNVFQFLRQAEEMERLTRVQSLKVTSHNPGKPEEGMVDVQMQMSIYYEEGK